MDIDISYLHYKEHGERRLSKELEENIVIKGMNFITPRTYLSNVAYLKYVKYRNKYIEKIIEKKVEYREELGALYVIEKIPHMPERCRAALWIKNINKLYESLDTLISLSKESGYKKINLHLEEETANNIINRYRCSINSYETMLYKEI
jgi:hypothetical protein